MVLLLAGAAMATVASYVAAQDSTSAQADPGKAVFESYCAACHGTAGKGDGPAGTGLQPPPRNFTTGGFKYGADLASVEHTISNGVTGTAMPAWGSILKPEEIEAAARYVMAFGAQKGGAASTGDTPPKNEAPPQDQTPQKGPAPQKPSGT
jgi:high-affinity iron transporter